MNNEDDIKNALVTGGTDGIGKQIALGLAQEGCRVAIVGRNEQKGSRAASEICWITGNRNVEFLRADLSLMIEAKRLADEIARRWKGLKYLVHSAGIVSDRWELTAEGMESNFAINYLSRFALTQELLPLLTATGQPHDAARIVIVNGAAQKGTIDFDDPNLSSNFGVLRMVGQSCRANDVFTIEQARRLANSDGPLVTITGLKLGIVRSNIRNAPDFPWWMKLLLPLADPFLAMTAENVAGTALKLLLSPQYEGITGALYMKFRNFKRYSPPDGVLDPEIGRRLWSLSERLANANGDRQPANPSQSGEELILRGENK